MRSLLEKPIRKTEEEPEPFSGAASSLPQHPGVRARYLSLWEAAVPEGGIKHSTALGGLFCLTIKPRQGSVPKILPGL